MLFRSKQFVENHFNGIVFSIEIHSPHFKCHVDSISSEYDEI